jgi:hypothetical protein
MSTRIHEEITSHHQSYNNLQQAAAPPHGSQSSSSLKLSLKLREQNTHFFSSQRNMVVLFRKNAKDFPNLNQ